MKVWLVKDGEQLPIDSGSRKHRMSNLGTELSARGHQVIWWTSTHSHQTKTCFFDADRTIALSENFQLRLLHSGGYPKNLSWQRLVHHNRFAWKLFQQMNLQPRPDVVVCCLPIVEAVYACLRYTRRFGIPLVVDIRDPWPDIWLERIPPILEPLAKLALSPYYFVTRRAFARAEVLVSISNRWLRWAIESGRRGVCELDSVIVHGVQPLRHGTLDDSPNIRTVLERLQGKLLFSFAGAFNRAYDLETVCKAAQTLQHRSEVHFLLAGNGPLYSALVENYGTLSNLTFLGWLKRPELDALLQNSHVGLIPYKGDMLGSKVYEYMSAGLPVVVSAFGDVQKLIAETDTGLPYRVGDSSDFAASVTRLAEDAALRERYSQNARACFEENFNARKVYGDYADIIERAPLL